MPWARAQSAHILAFNSQLPYMHLQALTSER